MTLENQIELSDKVTNIIENLACRIAEKEGGRITPHSLLPYLPISLGLVKACLDNMVDEISVSSDKKDNVVEYEFTAYKNSTISQEPLEIDVCLSCGEDRAPSHQEVLCSSCFENFQKELSRLSEKNGWPAHALYEHEILYLASYYKDSIHAEALAGRSRYTLGSVRRKLERMSLDGYLRQELDKQAGMMMYHLPRVAYPKKRYVTNIGIIRSYPASVMEEVQIKVVRILFVLGCMLFGLMIMAFMFRIPYPFLVMIFFAAAPLTALFIWRHRRYPEEE